MNFTIVVVVDVLNMEKKRSEPESMSSQRLMGEKRD